MVQRITYKVLSRKVKRGKGKGETRCRISLQAAADFSPRNDDSIELKGEMVQRITYKVLSRKVKREKGKGETRCRISLLAAADFSPWKDDSIELKGE
jgi:hypothetical protein